MSPDSRLGTDLGGYRLESQLGRGGMSVVYLATDQRLKRKVALKVLASELAEDERFRDRFIRESELAASLDHPNIVPIYEAGEVDGLLYIAMRYVEGTDLGKVIRADAPLEVGRVVALLRPVADALDVAHGKGLVHRDVKPANILIATSGPGGPEHIYLSDFGLTKRTTSVSGLTQTGQFMGTVDYVAPEQVQGSGVTGAADQYSLGCVAYECLTGSSPYPKESDVAVLWAHVNDPPPALPEGAQGPADAAVQRALSKRADDRYPTSSAFVEALAGAAGERVPAAGAPARRALRGRRAWIAAVVAIALIAAAVVGIVLADGGGAPPRRPGASTPALAVLPRGVNRIDLATNKSVANIPIENTSGEVAIGGGFVWALDHDGIAKIDPATNRQIAQVKGVFLHEVGGPSGIWAFDSEQTSPGVFNSDIVSVDADTNRAITLAGPIPVADMVFADGFVWVSNAGGAGGGPDPVVVRVDPTSGRHHFFVPESLPGGCTFEGCQRNILAVGAGAAWYINEDGTLTRLDLATEEDQKVALPKIRGVAFGDDYVWALLLKEDTVVQLDPDRMEPVKEIPVGPDTLSLTVGAGSLWAVSRGEGSVWRIDVNTFKTVKIGVGPGPGEVAVDEQAAWVTR
ncbi:MAG TPA: serine/threonine-protein kinase [Actinomycetota bacterium]|nr:serine/threonine-protein kinase [Actinomycetota bacterium]